MHSFKFTYERVKGVVVEKGQRVGGGNKALDCVLGEVGAAPGDVQEGLVLASEEKVVLHRQRGVALSLDGQLGQQALPRGVGHRHQHLSDRKISAWRILFITIKIPFEPFDR